MTTRASMHEICGRINLGASLLYCHQGERAPRSVASIMEDSLQWEISCKDLMRGCESATNKQAWHRKGLTSPRTTITNLFPLLRTFDVYTLERALLL